MFPSLKFQLNFRLPRALANLTSRLCRRKASSKTTDGLAQRHVPPPVETRHTDPLQVPLDLYPTIPTSTLNETSPSPSTLRNGCPSELRTRIANIPPEYLSTGVSSVDALIRLPETWAAQAGPSNVLASAVALYEERSNRLSHAELQYGSFRQGIEEWLQEMKQAEVEVSRAVAGVDVARLMLQSAGVVVADEEQDILWESDESEVDDSADHEGANDTLDNVPSSVQAMDESPTEERTGREKPSPYPSGRHLLDDRHIPRALDKLQIPELEVVYGSMAQ
ncbi:hypothetical protein BV25DRAFT_1841364 [Artomyces pyxidatus]|uniref:Uncharacterized protein n=1 Tax=Artomyces pyxidatus TaxID=48021 RepID=A0ACB8SQB9_9AGAM|nr:hypothetical protein BV25DRAFT_1841364 [Artomyces pyxidatus]